ncbi:jg2421 [Pararge aegeria aegeria]|uniref:Jg2421 protein n=1 Tax=Pararge aegeria aegeria TaxID=348720 RepID=A0A8S4QV15_9NEOP|nr:jg2421 [Pararge aegeria aegeria]
MFGCGHRTPTKPGTQEERSATSMSEGQVVGEVNRLNRLSLQDEPEITSKPESPNSVSRNAPLGHSKPVKKVVAAQGLSAVCQKKGVLFEVKIGSPDQGITKAQGRLKEAKACVAKVKAQLNSSRNTKTEIKTEVTQAAERLYQLVKEAEIARTPPLSSTRERENPKVPLDENQSQIEDIRKNDDLVKKLEEHSRVLKENTEEVLKLQKKMEKLQEEGLTYASVAAGRNIRRPTEQAALHSVVVTSKDEEETGEEVLNRIRVAINAKEGGVQIDKVRKAKDRKVIVGCETKEQRDKVLHRLRESGDHLTVEEIKNKDPLVVLKDVLQYNTDEDVLRALKNQNQAILKALESDDNRMEIRFRKKTRNPLTCHIIMRVSPKLWAIMTTGGAVHIDLQKIRVADQSPLIQCSICLGYGHSRRFCKETQEKCSHCGGAHMKSNCEKWLAGATPSCCNCTRAGLDVVGHNAFGSECAVRRKWEALARATIAYC